MEEKIHLNGKLISPDKAKISVFDYGFLYGYGVFETMRTYDGKIFRLDHHLARLKHGANRIGVLIFTSMIREAISETLAANPYKKARVRVAVSAGKGGMTPDINSCEEPTTAVFVQEYKPPKPAKYRGGFNLALSKLKRNTDSYVTALKSASAMESMIARLEAREAKKDETLLLNNKGHVAETAGCNIFMVKKGNLYTPGYEDGIMPGVTRVTVMELAGRLKMNFKEKSIDFKELLKADEVFITNSMIEIMPVTEIDGNKIGDGIPGPVTKKLTTAYRRLVTKENKLAEI